MFCLKTKFSYLRTHTVLSPVGVAVTTTTPDPVQFLTGTSPTLEPVCPRTHPVFKSEPVQHRNQSDQSLRFLSRNQSDKGPIQFLSQTQSDSVWFPNRLEKNGQMVRKLVTQKGASRTCPPPPGSARAASLRDPAGTLAWLLLLLGDVGGLLGFPFRHHND